MTPEEKEEQHQLRQEYLKGIRGQVTDTLSRIKFVEDENCGCSQHSHQHKHDKNCGCGCSGHHGNKGRSH